MELASIIPPDFQNQRQARAQHRATSGLRYRAISFFSCRNRHCPKCQSNARNKWLAARSNELLGVRYFHVVFTLPHELSALALQNKRAVYDLFQASAATLLEEAKTYVLTARLRGRLRVL